MLRFISPSTLKLCLKKSINGNLDLHAFEIFIVHFCAFSFSLFPFSNDNVSEISSTYQLSC